MYLSLLAAVVIFNFCTTGSDPIDPDVFHTTPVRSRHRIISSIQMNGTQFVSRQSMHSSYKHYAGYVARVGDNISIVCNESKAHTTLTVTRFLPHKNETTQVVNEEGRITVDPDSSISEVEIFSANTTDSGRYNCNNDAKYLTVIEPSNPPKVTDYYCISNTYNDLICTFQTNADKRDLVNWNITYTTKQARTCYPGQCVDMPCTKFKILPATNAYADDTIQCEIRDWIFVKMVYILRVTGENIYANSNDTFAAHFNYQIVKLAPPTILGHNITAFSASINVQLKEADMNRDTDHYGVKSFAEVDVLEYGVVYQILLDSPKLRERNRTDQVPRTLTYTDNDTSSWLEIPDLLPHTTYTLEIITQMNNTDNPNIWSSIKTLTVTTKDALPAVAPENSAYAFTVTDSTICTEGRLITLFWERVSERPGKGNGQITSYAVYNMVERDLAFSRLLSFTDEEHEHYVSTMVNGSKSSVEMCVGHGETVFGVIPVNYAGWARAAAKYYVPAARDMLKVRECDVIVTYYESTDMLEVTWPDIPKDYDVTVFWCEKDIQSNCLNEVLNWKEMGSANHFQLHDWKKEHENTEKGTLGYKFGLSAHIRTNKSSGIVWAPCINYLAEGLQPVASSVRLLGSEAQVTVEEKCEVNSRLPEYYRVYGCRYDKERGICLEQREDSEEVLEATLDRCTTSVTLLLHKHSTNYAFWVTSHAAAMSVNSSVIVRYTDRKALTWEIPVSVILSLLAVIVITLCLVYFRKQKKEVKRLKKPQLVLPTTMMIEEEEESDGYEGETDPQDALMQYGTTSQSFTPIIIKPVEMEAAPSFRDYENKECMEGSLDDTSDGCPSKYDCANLKPILSYQPAMSGLSDSTDYKNTSSATSCGRLPDDYLQCTRAEPELTMSAQWFLADDSHNTFIDLNKFLVPSETSPPAPRTPPEHTGKVTMSCIIESQPQDGEEGNDQKEAPEEAQITNSKQDVTSPGLTELREDNNSYCRITEYIVDPMTVQSHDENRVTTSQDAPENSSGDSGYVGRNAGTELCPRSNSLSSTES